MTILHANYMRLSQERRLIHIIGGATIVIGDTTYHNVRGTGGTKEIQLTPFSHT